MRGKFSYTLDNGVGLEITVEPSGKKEPEFVAEATIIKPEMFEESKSDLLDMVMSTGMKQLIEMKSWPEMWEVTTSNFELGKTDDEEQGLGLVFTGLGPNTYEA